MAWGQRTSRSGLYYGESGHTYYWDWSWFGSAVTFFIAMANCTVYARGRQFENGRPSPITSMPNANRWHTVVNTDEDWELLNYTTGMSLEAGDILEWVSNNHVAVCETAGTDPVISGSWYTGDDGTASSNRAVGGIMGSTPQSVSNYFQSHYVNRFWHNDRSISTESGSTAYPDYVIRYNGETPGPEPSTEDIIIYAKITGGKGKNVKLIL